MPIKGLQSAYKRVDRSFTRDAQTIARSLARARGSSTNQRLQRTLSSAATAPARGLARGLNNAQKYLRRISKSHIAKNIVRTYTYGRKK